MAGVRTESETMQAIDLLTAAEEKAELFESNENVPLDSDIQEVIDSIDIMDLRPDLQDSHSIHSSGDVSQISSADSIDEVSDAGGGEGAAAESGTDGNKGLDGSFVSRRARKGDEEQDGKKNRSKNGKKSKNPFQLLKRRTKTDHCKGGARPTVDLSGLTISKLPQVFVVKFLGKKECKGLYGLKHTREPVDQMISSLSKKLELSETVELPLVYFAVLSSGVDVREHGLNRVKPLQQSGFTPIQLISYGVQDIKFWRVFTFIVVKELRSRTKVSDVFAYLCDSSVTARRMTLSLGAAFKLYTRRGEGKQDSSSFCVELRPPEELAVSYSKDCDA